MPYFQLSPSNSETSVNVIRLLTFFQGEFKAELLRRFQYVMLPRCLFCAAVCSHPSTQSPHSECGTGFAPTSPHRTSLLTAESDTKHHPSLSVISTCSLDRPVKVSQTTCTVARHTETSGDECVCVRVFSLPLALINLSSPVIHPPPHPPLLLSQ